MFSRKLDMFFAMHINAQNVVLNILDTRSEIAHRQLYTIVLCNEQLFTLSCNDM